MVSGSREKLMEHGPRAEVEARATVYLEKTALVCKSEKEVDEEDNDLKPPDTHERMNE